MIGRIAIFASVVFLLSGSVFAEDYYTLEYKDIQDRRYGFSLRDTTLQAPAYVALPRFNCETPRFCLYGWNDKIRFPVALDKSTGSKDYDIVYIDTNLDGSLRDEKPINRKLKPEGNTIFFPPVDFPMLRSADPTKPYRVQVIVMLAGDRVYVSVNSAGRYEGTAGIGRKEYIVSLDDSNNNGSFTDMGNRSYLCDSITIYAKGSRTQYSRPLARLVCVDDKYYRIDMADQPERIKFIPADDIKTVRVSVPPDTTDLSICNDSDVFRMCPSEEKVLELPEGNYFIESWSVSRKGKDGNEWRISGGVADQNHKIALFGPSRIELPIAKDFVADLSYTRQGDTISFKYRLCGAMNESIDIWPARGGNRPPAPKLRIRNIDGSYNQKFDLEYG